MKKNSHWISRPVWLLFWGFTLSACSANPIPDLPSLRQQLQKPDQAVIKSIIDSSATQTEVLAVEGGALWFLAQAQQVAKNWQAAASLYQAQVEKGSPVWIGLAWRGWLESQGQALAWADIINQGPQLFEIVQSSLSKSSGDRVAADRELRLSREAWQKAEIEARIQLGQLDQAMQALGRVIAAWPDQTWPDWLAMGQAKLYCLKVLSAPKDLDQAFFQSQLRSILTVDAQAGHGELLFMAKAIAALKTTKKSLKLELWLQILQAKASLAQGLNQLSLDQFDALLLPRSKKAKVDQAAVRRRQAQLGEFLQMVSIKANAFWRDWYNAGRLAGQLSDTIGILGEAQAQIIGKAKGGESATAYIYELQGRLQRAKAAHGEAIAYFEKSLKLMLELERKGIGDIADRRRVQWYLLRSYTDQAGDQDLPQNFDLAGFSKQAALTDDPAYFEDVLEKAILITGGRQRWADLERLYVACGSRMNADLQAKCALVLARISQLRFLAGDAAEKAAYERFSVEAMAKPASIYYKALSRWIRSEPFTMVDLLGAQPVATLKPLPAVPSEQDGDWVAQVSQAFARLEQFDQGVDYLWDLRKEVSPERFSALGFTLVDAKRYRQGLRILESARVRFGHPNDQSNLAYFYPRPYLELIHRSVDNTSLPEWLMLAMVRTESNFDISANSGAGARGLAQLMPATAKLVAHGLGLDDADLDDPEINLRLGSTYLREQYQRFGKWPQALAAYNAGMGRVRNWVKSGLPNDPILFAELIPVEESRNYVRRIVESSLFYNWLYYGLDNQALFTLVFQTP